MRILWRMIMRQFFMTLLVTWIGCIVIFELVDFFTNLPTLLQYSDNIGLIFQNLALHLPRSMVVSVTPAVLFSITYVLGNLYMRNELIIILGGGISLIKLVTPLLLFSLVIGIAATIFDDQVAIDYSREKDQLLDEFRSGSRTQGVDFVYANSGHRIVYAVEFFVDGQLYNPSVFVRNQQGELITRIDAERATFSEELGYWEFQRAQVFRIDPTTKETTVEVVDTYSNPVLSDEPKLFLSNYSGLGDLTISEATEYLEELRLNRSSTYVVALTDYYARFAGAFVTFVVALFSCGLGSRLKRNILLMSLLLSVTITVFFFVLQEVMVLFAKNGLVIPEVGAFGSLGIGLLLGIILFRRART